LRFGARAPRGAVQWSRCALCHRRLKRLVDRDHDPLGDYFPRGVADEHSACSNQRVVVVGEGAGVVEGLGLRPRVRIREVNEPGRVEEVSSANYYRTAEYPTRGREILWGAGDLEVVILDVGEAYLLMLVRV